MRQKTTIWSLLTWRTLLVFPFVIAVSFPVVSVLGSLFIIGAAAEDVLDAVDPYLPALKRKQR